MSQIILPYNTDNLIYDKDFYKDYGIFVKPINYAMSTRKIESLLEIAKMQKYFQCNPVKAIDIFFNIELLDSQALAIQRTWICPNSLIVATRGWGKALSLDTRIPTPNGDKTIKDIQIGDEVFDEAGLPVKVINTSIIFENHDCYKLIFSDGEEIVADADHIWSVYDRWNKNKQLIDIDTKTLYQKYKIPKRNTYSEKWNKDYNEVRYSVPMNLPLYYKAKQLPIHPYILGIWLGDGCSETGYITCHINDCEEMCNIIKSVGYKIYSITNDSKNNKRITIHDMNDKPLVTLLKENNLINNKHIPNIYKYSSVSQRLSLLSGLMDTDGTIEKEGYAEFTQSIIHRNITDSFADILSSLGIKFTMKEYIRKCNGKEFLADRIHFTPSKLTPCFKLKRKFERLKDNPIKTSTKKQITCIEKVDSVPTKCISVDNDSHLFLCGKKNTVTHNSTVIDLSLMSKDMCFSNYWSYIASGSGSQAEQTFTTLERLANDNIDTFSGSSGIVFKNEIEIKNAAGDGFSHGTNGFSYSLYNGSYTQTLNSNIDAKRGYRGSVIFDESGFLSEEMMNVYSAFAVVNRGLKTGKDSSGKSIDPIRQRCFPADMPYQKIYISSASSTDTKFFALYKDFSKKQIMGDPDYCVLHIDCELAFKPTMRGELIAPLLSRSTVQSEMRTNPEKARREYYCQFTTDAGTNAIIKRGVITRNEEIRKPLLYNDTGDKKFVICYDPARSRDNSAVLVGEIYDSLLPDGSYEKKMRLVNSINLLDVGKKIKSPMRTPDQIEYLKKIILDYNGGADAYGNIIGIYIDAGSGGGGVNIADYLMEDWVSESGITHRGLIDAEYSAEYIKRFPNAVDKLHLIEPSKYKSEMYEALIELMTQDKVSFTAQYDGKDYLTVFDVDEELVKKERERIMTKLKKENLDNSQLEAKIKEELDKVLTMETKMIKLDWQDKISLSNMDALKEELVNMVRRKRDSGKDSFELTPEKANKLHDDRAYTAALACHALMIERRKNITQKKRSDISAQSLVQSLTIRKAKSYSSFD